MLEKLVIKNYVLIEDLEIDFSTGLNILTGETGAGKSIILSALQMATGARADLSVFLDPTTKCIVELHYDIGKFSLQSIFDQLELEYEDKLIVRREILPSGKSRSFINDSVASLQQIKSLSRYLVDFHKQFDNLEIQDLAFHREVIDILAKVDKELATYQKQFRIFQSTKSEIERLKKLEANSGKDLDYMSFQLNELKEMALVEGELEEREEVVRVMSSSEELEQKFGMAKSLLIDNEQSGLELMRSIYQQVAPLREINDKTREFCDRLDSLIAETEDISGLVSSILSNIEYDPNLLLEHQERLSGIYRLIKKYNVEGIQDLLEIQSNLNEKINGIANFSDRISSLENQLVAEQESMEKAAQKLTNKRKKIIPAFEKKLIGILESLSFKNVQFVVRLDTLEAYDEFGNDEIEFLFTANKGKEVQSLFRIASGGEISRVMLSIKSVIADSMALPTLVFDEIDTGISGDVAMKTGKILKEISHKHQIISITHSPQVASRADLHFRIYKTEENNQTISKMEVLEDETRIEEIATMLSGSPPSANAIENARELILA